MKTLFTLRNTPCLVHDYRQLPIYKHFLFGELFYDLTKPILTKEGLTFELHDDGGFIDKYTILKEDLDLVEVYDNEGNLCLFPIQKNEKYFNNLT
jgi:hypothetical protein